jgi:hypothetical protein
LKILEFTRQRIRRFAVSGMAMAFAASSLVLAQPAAADTTYPVNVTFDSVKFTMVYDGCIYHPFDFYCDDDHHIEVYGGVAAYTTAGAPSAAGVPYRNFGKWGQEPCTGHWTDASGSTCDKDMTFGTYYFNNVLLCRGASVSGCSTGYAKGINTVTVQVHEGEQFKMLVNMQDYDWGSANDNVCVASTWFGPYTAAQLQAKTYINDAASHPLNMGYNGNAECWVGYHLS